MDPIKPGWKTSEFWLSLLAVIVGAVASSGILPGGAPTQVAGIASTVLGALGYGANRSAIKRAVPPVAALAVLLLASPAHADPPAPVKPSLALPVAPAVPVVAPEPAAPPTVANIAMCTAASLPDAIGKCAGVAPLPPIDTRTFTTVVISGSVALIQLGAGLLTIYLNPQPVGK